MGNWQSLYEQNFITVTNELKNEYRSAIEIAGDKRFVHLEFSNKVYKHHGDISHEKTPYNGQIFTIINRISDNQKRDKRISFDDAFEEITKENTPEEREIIIKKMAGIEAYSEFYNPYLPMQLTRLDKQNLVSKQLKNNSDELIDIISDSIIAFKKSKSKKSSKKALDDFIDKQVNKLVKKKVSEVISGLEGKKSSTQLKYLKDELDMLRGESIHNRLEYIYNGIDVEIHIKGYYKEMEKKFIEMIKQYEQINTNDDKVANIPKMEKKSPSTLRNTNVVLQKKGADDIIISQFHKLLEVAINLKEKFDKNEPPKVIEAWAEFYEKELDALKKIVPKEVFQESKLIQHSSFLIRHAKDHKPEDCYNDIRDICLVDISFTERVYLSTLSETLSSEVNEYGWYLIHPHILKIAKPRFDGSHYADAVEASFKEINDVIKLKYKSVKSVELDGVKLMREAFTSTLNNNFTPVFPIADNLTENGKSIQQGYMEIFAGSMLGIRNPKAHSNLDVHPDEAWEMIVLASHLMRMWDR